MITVISGTNRTSSNTLHVAKHYTSILKAKEQSVKLLDLQILPHDFIFSCSYGNSTPEFDALVEEFITNSDKFIFVVPEYNGSYPGIVKAFLDCVPPKFFHNKKAGLVGLSSGRAGNLRGTENLTGVLHYLQVEVMSRKPKFSGIDAMVNENGISDETSLKMMEEHVEKLLNF
jgi:chromate reductase